MSSICSTQLDAALMMPPLQQQIQQQQQRRQQQKGMNNPRRKGLYAPGSGAKSLITSSSIRPSSVGQGLAKQVVPQSFASQFDSSHAGLLPGPEKPPCIHQEQQCDVKPTLVAQPDVFGQLPPPPALPCMLSASSDVATSAAAKATTASASAAARTAGGPLQPVAAQPPVASGGTCYSVQHCNPPCTVACNHTPITANTLTVQVHTPPDIKPLLLPPASTPSTTTEIPRNTHNELPLARYTNHMNEGAQWTVEDKAALLGTIATFTQLRCLHLRQWLLVPMHVEQDEVDARLRDSLRDCLSSLHNLRELHMDVVTGAHMPRPSCLQMTLHICYRKRFAHLHNSPT
jgi:hypothetical protein